MRPPSSATKCVYSSRSQVSRHSVRNAASDSMASSLKLGLAWRWTGSSRASAAIW